MKVRVKIRVRLADGTYPFFDPVLSANGKLKPLYAVVGGKPEHHPEGSYFLRYADGSGKRVWERVGNDPQLALTTKLKRELGEKQSDGDLKTDTGKLGLTESIEEYLLEVKQANAKRTYLAYSLTLNSFAKTTTKKYLDAIDRKDILAFLQSLRDAKCGPRTLANRLAYLRRIFTRFDLKMPILKTDRVKYTQKAVSSYSAEELKALFAAATPEEYELFQFFLCTGAREQEVTYATWPDLDFHRKTFKVSEKLDLGFRPKDKEEGSIPLPDDFVELMRARKSRMKTRLIFPGADGKPNGHFLRLLKRLAYRAGLNCGACYNRAGKCCADGPRCRQWGLHRFRKSFATMHHESGVSARTIQRWLRHSSLDTTLRYLAGSDDQSEKTRGLVNSTFAAITR